MSVSAPSRSAKLFVPVSAVCLAAGFAGGWWFGKNQPDSADAARRLRASTASPLTSAPSPVAGRKGDGGKHLFEGPPATNRQTAKAQFRSAMETIDPLERMKNALAVFDQMTPENGQAYYDGWLDYVNENGPPMPEAALFDRKIGEVIGPVVVGRRTGTAWDMSHAHNAVREQFIGWMYSDPAAAKKWMDDLKNETFRENLLDAYTAATARKDLPAALTFLKTLPADLQAESAAVIVTAAKAEKSQEELGVWLNGLVADAGDQKNIPWLHATSVALMESLADARMVGPSAVAIYEQHRGQPCMDDSWGPRLAGAYARSDTAGGLAWAAKMSGSGGGQFVEEAVSGVQPEKLDEALQWALTPASGALRGQILDGIARRFDPTDPARAAQVRALIEPAPSAAGN